jgi:cytosine/adenosine deaminase-related metal-dependent hydrolase
MGNLLSPICYDSLQVHEVATYLFITYKAARALRLEDYGIEPGCRADLNVLAAPTVREVLRLQQPRPGG